jgi:hypothetical protein
MVAMDALDGPSTNRVAVRNSFDHRMLGGAVYTRWDEPGIEAWHNPERRKERQRREELEKNDQDIELAFNQERLASHTNATKMLIEWLKSRGNSPEFFTGCACAWRVGALSAI